MKISERRIRDFALGVLLVLTAYALAGCDGEGGADPLGDSGAVNPCDKSDAIVVVSASHSGTPEQQAVELAAQARQLCVGWSVRSWYASSGTGAECATELGHTMPANTAAAECSLAMTDEVCSDAAHDFVDSAGVKHAFYASQKGGSWVLAGFGIVYQGVLLQNGSAPHTICTPSRICLSNCH